MAHSGTGGTVSKRNPTTRRSFTRIPKIEEFIKAGVYTQAIPTYCALADYANNKTGEAHPSIYTLAKKLGVTRRTIERHLAVLESAGFITRVRQRRHKGRYSSNDYELVYFRQMHADQEARKTAPMIGLIYLVKSERGLYKIGYTRNMSSRLSYLRKESSVGISLIYAFESTNVREDEAALHKRYAHRRIYSEWFELAEDEVDEFCSIASSEDVDFLGLAV